MSIGYVVSLDQDAVSLVISAGRYSTNFLPTTAAEALSYSAGTSANRTSGSIVTGRRGINQTVSFDVRVMGATEAEVTRGGDDLVAMIRRAGDENNPLYLSFLPNSYLPYKPTWGQGGWKRLQIVNGTVRKSDIYMVADIRAKAMICSIELEIKPYIYGIRQRIANATASVYENYYGSATGEAIGLYIRAACTNLFTNPIFGNATWNNAWTAGSNVTAAKNTDPRFRLPEAQASAYLVSSSDSTNNTYTQSLTLTVATYTISAYVKKQDGSAVTATDCKVYYLDAGAITSTYRSLGNGWYMVYASTTGAASAKATGLAITGVGTGVYLAAMQVELSDFPTPLVHGEQLGAAFSGTAHASSSAATAGSLVLDRTGILSLGSGSVRAVMKMECDQTAAQFCIFNTSSGFDAYYNATDDKFYFTDGTNTISSAAQTWAIGDVIILHFVWGYGSLKIYKAGVEIATGSSYTQPAANDFYLGTSTASAEHLRGMWLGFSIYDRTLSASEVLNDYTNITQVSADGQMVDKIPVGHNGLLVNSIASADLNDVAAAARCFFFGIPGDVPGDTFWNMTFSGATGTGVDAYLSQNVSPRITKYLAAGINYLYRDISGGAETASVNTSPVSFVSTEPLVISRDLDCYLNKRAWIIAKISDAGANLRIAATYNLTSSGTQVIGTYVARVPDGTARYFLLGPVKMPEYVKYWTAGEVQAVATINAYLSCYRTVAGAANVTVADYALLVGNMARIVNAVTGNMILQGRRALIYDGTSITVLAQSQIIGDVIDLAPNAINIITPLQMDDGATTGAANATRFAEVAVTPRYLMT